MPRISHRLTYQLHADNLVALAEADASLGAAPSYTTVRRLMNIRGFFRQKRRARHGAREGDDKSRALFESRETRSFECEYVHELWHLDYHTAKYVRVLRPNGEWVAPKILGTPSARTSSVGGRWPPTSPAAHAARLMRCGELEPRATNHGTVRPGAR